MGPYQASEDVAGGTPGGSTHQNPRSGNAAPGETGTASTLEGKRWSIERLQVWEQWDNKNKHFSYKKSGLIQNRTWEEKKTENLERKCAMACATM